MTDSISSRQGCDPDCDQVVNNIQDMLRNVPYLPPSRDCCIHKVPVDLRIINEAAYTPQLISIGPLHRGDKKLLPMQAYKISFLNTLLRRKPSVKLEDCVKTLREFEKQVRNSYFNQEFVCNISSNDFVQMMLLDGCFIVELLITSCCPTNRELLPWPRPYRNTVKQDLMLYENQLPYFLLEHLFNFINDDNPICPVSFFDLSARYFSYFLNEKDALHRLKDSGHQVRHFLDLILNCHRPLELTFSVEDDNTDRKEIYLPSATVLHESGVEFKKGDSHCDLDISSNKNGVLEIPLLDVTDNTEHIFRNMIAMEQCQDNDTVLSAAYITHYMFLLDFLISTPKDVALLRSKRIINNYLGSDEAVAQLFNKLGTNVIADVVDSPYYEHINNIDAFYNRRRNKWKANLKKSYFRNPWTIISLTAAIVLLICTFTQTVCSIFSLKK